MNISLAGAYTGEKVKDKGIEGNRKRSKSEKNRATSQNILKSSNSALSVGGVICAPGALTLIISA